MDIKFKRNETVYILSEDYSYNTILSCYTNNILTYKINLSNSLVYTTLCENYATITVYRRSQKHKLNEQCCLIIAKDCEYIQLQCKPASSNYFSFIDFVKDIQTYNIKI